MTAKSAMHDNLAASIIVMKQYLSGDFGGIDVETVLREWEKNIVFREVEHLSEKEKLFASARSSGVLVQIEGKEPPGKAAEMMYAAMQEPHIQMIVLYAVCIVLLLNRIETEGGRMLVQSFPEFALVIEIPKI